MELRQLKYFVSIVDCGSLSKATASVFVAQSALSHQLAQLESELGTLLLHRSSKGVSLTESGEVLYRQALAILQQVNDIKSAVRSSSEYVVGSVVLGIPQSITVALALPLLVAARERLPGISLQLNEELLGNLASQLRRGTVNLAILFDNGQFQEFEYEGSSRRNCSLSVSPTTRRRRTRKPSHFSKQSANRWSLPARSMAMDTACGRSSNGPRPSMIFTASF
jgi:LysR family transcriptional regulator, nitrogen assimilation regulatory protein